MDKESLNLYWILALRVILLIAAIIGVIWFVDQISWVISLILVSILIVYAIAPATDWLEKQKLSRTWAAAITFLALVSLIVGFLLLTIPRLYNEVKALADFAPAIYQELSPYITHLDKLMEGTGYTEYLGELFETIPETLEGIQGVLQQLTHFSMEMIGSFFEFLIVMFLVFYLLREIKEIRNSIINLIPKDYQQEASKVLSVIDLKVGQYLRGNLVRCSIVGLFSGLGLLIIDIHFFFILGVIAAIFNIIPYIGPYIAAFPAILVALSYSLETALIVAILYIVIQCIDAFVMTPFLLGKAVDLKPFSIILAILIGGTLYNIIGILLAIPLVATIKVLVNYYYFESKYYNRQTR